MFFPKRGAPPAGRSDPKENALKPTKTVLIEKIVAASEELDRVSTLLQAIDALRPREPVAYDNATAVTTLALEALEIIHTVQNSLFAGNEGKAA